MVYAKNVLYVLITYLILLEYVNFSKNILFCLFDGDSVGRVQAYRLSKRYTQRIEH